MQLNDALGSETMEELQDTLDALLGRLSRAAAHIDRSTGTRHGTSNVGALRHLALGGPVRMSTIAEASGLDPSTVSRKIAAFEAKGLVERSKDPDDARASLLHVTEAGQSLLRQHRQVRIDLILRLLDDWDPADSAELARLLAKLNASLAAKIDELITNEEVINDPSHH